MQPLHAFAPPPLVDWIVGFVLAAAPVSGHLAPELAVAAAHHDVPGEHLMLTDGDTYPVVPPAPGPLVADPAPPAAPVADPAPPVAPVEKPSPALHAPRPEPSPDGFGCELELIRASVLCACRPRAQTSPAEGPSAPPTAARDPRGSLRHGYATAAAPAIPSHAVRSSAGRENALDAPGDAFLA